MEATRPKPKHRKKGKSRETSSKQKESHAGATGKSSQSAAAAAAVAVETGQHQRGEEQPESVSIPVQSDSETKSTPVQSASVGPVAGVAGSGELFAEISEEDVPKSKNRTPSTRAAVLNIVAGSDDVVRETEPSVDDESAYVAGESLATPLATNLESESTIRRTEELKPTNQITEQSALPKQEESAEVLLTNQTLTSTEVVVASAPALIDHSVGVASQEVGVAESSQLMYPRLDSITQEVEGLEADGEGVMLVAFSEEDLALLYPNHQLDANHTLIDTFIRHSNQERHELYEMLVTYLRARQGLTTSEKQVEGLRGTSDTYQPLLWSIETKQITSMGKCGDGNKLSHSHSHKVAVFNPAAAEQITSALASLRGLLQEELCMRSYSCQLARLHVEHYLFLLMQSLPELSPLREDAPVASWIPSCPPGGLDGRTARLRDCISVLFMFERRPIKDKEFSADCRRWLDVLLSALLRIATLSDHQFIFNHILRCPPGVSKWSTKYLQVLSPLLTTPLLQAQFQQGGGAGVPGGAFNTGGALMPELLSHRGDVSFSYEWGVGVGLHSDWGGPLLDHFVTMLATLLLPIRDREQFLSLLESPRPEPLSAQTSQPWTFVDEEDCSEDLADGGAGHLLLKESDFISLLDQFPFTDLFQYVLCLSPHSTGEASVDDITSHQMLRLIAFCSCLVRLLGNAFSTLRLSCYREFIKQVGRTVRQSVQYVADYWMTYLSHQQQQQQQQQRQTPSSSSGDGRGGGEPGYSLQRLQLEFDQFVLRSTKCILTAHKLGAWQFLADMPYGSVTLNSIWKIFWTLYCKQLERDHAHETGSEAEGAGSLGGATRSEREASPDTVDDIQSAVKGGSYKEQFVDTLMKTYTSEAVFLLTTFVNMARARPADSLPERSFIEMITLEIFEVVEFARDAYSRTGQNLLDAIAIVHPFVISALLGRVVTAVRSVGENSILLFKVLPLHLWVPESHDLRLITHWLVDRPLGSHENMLARVILSGLNWGTKSDDGSTELVLPWSVHCAVGLGLVDAHSKHLSCQPGGRDYAPGHSSLGKYATLGRSGLSSVQQEFVSWAWEVVLMLKLHPSQVLSTAVRTLRPSEVATPTGSGTAPPTGGGSSSGRMEQRSRTFAGRSRLTPGERGERGEGWRARSSSPVEDPARQSMYQCSQPPWVHLTPGSEELVLPDLTSSSERELADLRDSVKYEGLLAYYVALCLTSIGTDMDHFLASGVSMLTRLLEQGYYFPALRVLANVTPRFFNHSTLLLENTSFIQVVLGIANSDSANASWIPFTSSAPMVLRKMAALIQTQVQSGCGLGGVGGATVLQFWLDVILSCPAWHRERSMLFLLDSLALAVFGEGGWEATLQETLEQSYRELNPTQPKRSIMSSVYSSMVSMVGQDGGPPSLFSAVPSSECPWLAFHCLCAEERFERAEGVWSRLLGQLKKDSRTSVDNALKRAFAELKMPGGFGAAHLCIYRWAEFCATLDHTHPLYPLLWQRFFRLYLQRPILDGTLPERESYGLRFFSTSRWLSLRRRMKTALSQAAKHFQEAVTRLGEEGGGEEGGGGGEDPSVLRAYYLNCLSFYQTLRLWLEEPRLHNGSLYLPGLPPQYQPDRLTAVFQDSQTVVPWLEFVPRWEVKGQLNTLVGEWVQAMAYQKSLPCRAQLPETSPDTAVTRIQKRLRKTVATVPPPPFVYCHAPFSLLSQDVLLSRDALLAVLRADVQFISDQAKSYCVKSRGLTTLDQAFLEGVPLLYTNEPSQFHVRVPCHSRFKRSHQCQSPATIVFRFNQMTVSPRWEQQLEVNRVEYRELLTALTSPVSHEFGQAVIRMEHSVAELSRLAAQSSDTHPNIPLQCGIALFYEILGFIDADTRQFPPSCQFLTSCVQILGQEFIQRDPLQTSNILELLLSQRGQPDLLAPLFQPNSCPDQFLGMYGCAAEMAIKEGPSIAFSVLTKFNLPSWLLTFDPSASDVSQLMEYVFQGLTLCGPQPTRECEILVELYRRHFSTVTQHRFPQHYNEALQMVISGTDNSNIVLQSWEDLGHMIREEDHAHLGLKQLQETARLLSQHYLQLRTTSMQTLFSLINKEYVPFISKFIHQLCLAMVAKWAESISMGTTAFAEAVPSCWQFMVDVFAPWVAPLQLSVSPTDDPAILLPCQDSERRLLCGMVELLADCISVAHTKIRDPSESVSFLGLLWQYYFTSLALPSTPEYIMVAYHASLASLPWSYYFPDLAALESMMKLKLMEQYPASCFVFLGKIFPSFDWRSIVAAYCDVSVHGNPSAPTHLHIMLLQLLIMLASEEAISNSEDSGIAEVMGVAQDFHWENIDAKTYQDILQWLKGHCHAHTVLHTGSCLSLSLRLLKAAAGFPSSNGPREHLNSETWLKRQAYVQTVVELVGQATHKQSTHQHSYSDAISHLFQTAIDVCIHEPGEWGSGNVVLLLQEILNLLNISATSGTILKELVQLISAILGQMTNAHLLALPIITAGCRTMASYTCFSQVIERAIECHFSSLHKPKSSSLELPPDAENGYGWKSVTNALTLPEDSEDFTATCISECAVLILHASLLQQLPQCQRIQDELVIAARAVQWSTQFKPKPDAEAKLFLLWDKTIRLLLRQVRYSGNFAALVPHFASLASSMARFGEDKATEGILGVIGLGKKSLYSQSFRLISRAMSAFLQCQMPVDLSQSTQLRVVPSAPGHVKDPIRTAPNTTGVAIPAPIVPTKLGDQCCNSLESLMSNKHYAHLKDHAIYAVSFVGDVSNCVMNANQLLVHLSSTLYPDLRYLDQLRMLQV